MNSLTKTAALAVKNKIYASREPLALFRIEYGGWITTRTSTENYRKRMRIDPQSLIGIFDINATVQMLEEDLEAAGVK